VIEINRFKITKPKEIGKKTFQPNRINWSYRKRGKVVRTQINKIKLNRIFSMNKGVEKKI